MMTEGAIAAVEGAGLIARLGPFEPSAHLAVAVSGGADSMALCLIAADWAAHHGGRVTALTVDHGLRPEARAEARQVARWLARWKIAHRILTHDGPVPRANVQAAARDARYALLTAWCRDHGVLHLALGHHREDQAETLLLRLGRGSGVDGLAAMAAIAETPWLRLLRPLLDMPRARLMATLATRDQTWIEDPSNRDPVHARIRIRGLLPVLAREGLTSARLAATAARLGRARAALEDDTAALLADAVAIRPAGYCLLERHRLAAAPAEIGLRALARLLACVGGGRYPPRLARLSRLHAAITARDPESGGPEAAHPRGRTLAGCRILPRQGRLLICREPAAVAPPATLDPRTALLWDNRFIVDPARRGAHDESGGALFVGKLGRAGWRTVRAARPDARDTAIPPAARPALPAFYDREGLLAVPHLGYCRLDIPPTRLPTVRFAPSRPLAGARFHVTAVVL